MRQLFPLLTGILLITGLTVSAQTTTHSSWVAVFGTFKINKKLSIHFDGQPRSTDKTEHLQTLLLRTGLNVHVKKNMIATAGYAYIHNRRTVGPVTGYAPEHRFWEQFIVSHSLLNGSLSHRFRLEQRFIGKSVVEDNSLKTEGNVYANRFRYFFRGILPIPSADKGPFLALQNEVFVNIGDKSVVNGEFFDQNRAYAAVGYRFNKAFAAEVGYMNQYVQGRNDAFVNNHIVQLAGYVNL